MTKRGTFDSFPLPDQQSGCLWCKQLGRMEVQKLRTHPAVSKTFLSSTQAVYSTNTPAITTILSFSCQRKKKGRKLEQEKGGRKGGKGGRKEGKNNVGSVFFLNLHLNDPILHFLCLVEGPSFHLFSGIDVPSLFDSGSPRFRMLLNSSRLLCQGNGLNSVCFFPLHSNRRPALQSRCLQEEFVTTLIWKGDKLTLAALYGKLGEGPGLHSLL